MKRVFVLTAVLALLGLGVAAQAVVTIDTVTVGNAGNTADTTGFGAVSSIYNIGTYEVTAGQYTEFLNAKAKLKYTGFDPNIHEDTYGLYNSNMGSIGALGCNIQRSGSGTVASPYTYTVAPDWANRPVNWVSYWDACRFSNWLGNGQGDGDTENGAYTIPNSYNGMDGRTIQRNSGWKWAVTNENEWYKAAYYDPDKADGAGYWLYPTRTNALPSNVGADGYADPGNHANFNWQNPNSPWNETNTIGSPYWRSNVGEFENSGSAYGTFDQGGNVWEWTEAIIDGGPDYVVRSLRGGALNGRYYDLRSSGYAGNSPLSETPSYGFRVVQAVPEPSSLIALGALVTPLLAFRRRKA